MKSYNVSLIPGDGIGPEISDVTIKIIEATGVKINWEVVEAGADVMGRYGTPLPESTLNSIRKNKVGLKGPITTPIGTGFRSVNVAIRKELDLYCCLRPCKTFKGLKTSFENVDIVIVRENTEDLYAGVEFPADSKEAKQITALDPKKIREHSAISIKPISVFGSERIARFAFDYAIKNNRKKVTAVTKANIMKFTDGLFFETARKVAKEYEGKYEGKVEYEERLIDNMCMQLVQKPQLYDMLLLPNLYGDIASDLCAGLIGGLGLAPGANFGTDCAVFEAVHGSAPKYKGLNKVNPTALILSAALMLKHLGENIAAISIENAVAAVIKEGKTLTYDMGGSAGTKEFGNALIENIKRNMNA